MNARTSILARLVPDRRHAVLAILVLGSLVWVLSHEPISQDQAYHGFTDTRAHFGVSNFGDAGSNLAFFLVGLIGVSFCIRTKRTVSLSWMVFFAGVGLTSIGSAYYHLRPTDATLVWDRLPMTIAFMGLFTAILGDQVSRRVGSRLLLPAVLVGLGSVIYWQQTDDLRPYFWVQLVPLLAIPAVTILFRRSYSHQWLLLVALGWYVLAKVAETHDATVFQQTGGLVSGHTLKHLLAASSCFVILLMLQKRKPVMAPGPDEDCGDEDAAELLTSRSSGS